MLTRCRPLLGTFVEVTVPRCAASAIDTAFAAIDHVQQRTSFHYEASDLARLRRARPGDLVEVAPETVAVLRIAVELYRQSEGLFDVTIGRELVRAGFLPRPAAYRPGRFSGSAADIEIVDDRHVRCHRAVLIDLGGIAKGFAVDRAVEALQSAGVFEGLVNAGGDLRMFGDREWEIQLRDADETVRWQVMLADCAIASSANLVNRHKRLGRVHTPHIGFRRTSVLANKRTSVVAELCVIADAMTKIAIADRDLAKRLLPQYGGYLLTEPAVELAA